MRKQFNSFYMASDFVAASLDLLKHRATTSAGKPVSVLLASIAGKKCHSTSFFLGSLFSTCLDCFLILVLTHNECVAVFIQCFCPILLCFILCLVLIFQSGKPSWWILPFSKILMVDATMKEIINCRHNAKSLNFYFPVVKNKFPPVFHGMASYFPWFSALSHQNKLQTPSHNILTAKWRKS